MIAQVGNRVLHQNLQKWFEIKAVCSRNGSTEYAVDRTVFRDGQKVKVLFWIPANDVSKVAA